MNIDVRIVPQGHSELSEKTMLESVRGDLPPFSEAVICKGSIDRTGSVLVVKFGAEVQFELECSRCLEKFTYPLHSVIQLIIKESAAKQGLAEEDDMVDFYYNPANEVVDVSAAIYDEFMIGVPLKPLCSQSCKGIQIQSEGIRLDTQKSSSQEKKQVDPRWEKLLKLKNQASPE